MTNFRLTYDPKRNERVTLEHRGFDEFVLKGRARKGRPAPCLIHIEQMDTDTYWAAIGDAYVTIWQDKAGDVHVGIRRGEYDPARGWTEGTGFRHAHDEKKIGEAEGAQMSNQLGLGLGDGTRHECPGVDGEAAVPGVRGDRGSSRGRARASRGRAPEGEAPLEALPHAGGLAAGVWWPMRCEDCGDLCEARLCTRCFRWWLIGMLAVRAR